MCPYPGLYIRALRRWLVFIALPAGVLGLMTLKAADKNGVAPNSISVPKGPGSIEGLGESFQPTLNTGTAKYGVSFRLPAGTSGFGPSLVLAYEAGTGNGPQGFGWNLRVPSIQRQTDKGIPLYSAATNGPLGQSDRFINEAREELIPVGSDTFFCKNEGAFIRYRWAQDHWEATRPDGTQLVFGAGSESRIENSADPTQVFEWLLERETDTHGNVVQYHYATTNSLRNLNQKYLAGISYGPGQPPFRAQHFVRFHYEPRTDWLEDGRAGFLIRTGLRLRDVVIGTQGVQLPSQHATGDWNGDQIADVLVRRYQLEYLAYAGTNSHWSLLHRVRQFGSTGTNELPALSLGYLVCDPPALADASSRWLLSENPPPTVMDAEDAEFVDLNGDGLPDILRTLGDGIGGLPHEAWLNLGVKGGKIRWVRQEMSGDAQAFTQGLRTNVVHLADMDGDGLADLVVKDANSEVRYFRNDGRLAWEAGQPMVAADFPPPAPFGNRDVRVADIDFDKRADVIRSLPDGSGYRYWLNLGQQRYSRELAATAADPVPLDLAVSGTELADLNGDRIPDLTQIRPQGVEFAAGLGYGRFTPKEFIALADPPDDEAVMAKAKLTDITGDGLADLVIEQPQPGELWYWVNLGNRTFSTRHRITGLPVPENLGVALRWADVNGNGTSDLVYADSKAANRLVAVDVGELAGCAPGNHLLTAITNGIGRITTITYRPSTEYRLADAEAGKPWPDAVPFPVPVVARVDTFDSLGHRYATEFRYHDGYYDPEQKQFRGFARVEQVDLGDASAPTLVSRSYFDTGRDHEVMKGKVLRLTTEQEDGRQFTDEATGWIIPPITLYEGMDGRSVVYAHPTNTVRQIKELGQGIERRLESEVGYDRFGNQLFSHDYGLVEAGNRSAFNDERFTTNRYALNTNAWILRAPASSELADESGTTLSRSEFYYDDPTFSGSNLGEVTRGDLTLKLDWVDPARANAFIRSARTRYDNYGNPVLILDPLALPATGDPDLSDGHAREIAYETNFFTYPVRETIHLGNGKEPLLFQADYDEGFGTVLTSTDFNGNTTRYGYDEFGRLINTIRPGDTDDFPTAEYSYVLAVPYFGTNLINYVESRLLDKTNRNLGSKRESYLIARDFVDGLGRKLMSKSEAEAAEAGGPPRVVVKGAVLFNARQKPATVLNPYFSTLAGSLDDQLAYEHIEDSDWSGQFGLSNALVTLNLAAAHRSTTTYNATLRELTATNPDGTSRRTVYKPLLTKSYDENDNDPASPDFDTPMVHHNDGLGRLIRVDEITRLTDEGTPTNALKVWTTRYEYDLNDQLTKITDSQNNVKVMAYDGLKRKTFMNDPDRGVMHFVFDDASNLTETTDAKGQRIRYTYDGANRIRTEDYLDEGQPFSRNFTYDPLRPVSLTNRADVVYFYDTPLANLDMGDGTLATATNVKGKLAYVWDLSGEEHTSHDARDRVAWVVKRVRDPLHGQLVSYRTGFDYDAMDRLTSLTYPDNDAIGYRYNDRSLLLAITGGPTGSVISNVVYFPSDQQDEILYGNGIRTAYAYDERLRLNQLNTAPRANPASPFIALDYAFDGVSNIRSITDQRPEAVVPAGDKRRNTQLFQYDDLYRLTRVQYSFTLLGVALVNNGEINYRYDRIGNMMVQHSTIDDIEQGLPLANLGDMDSGGAAGRWNRVGRTANEPPGPHALTAIRHAKFPTRNYPYDANGNMTDLDGMVATWDFKDRLVGLEDAIMRAEYVYDFTDRRITKRVTKKNPATPVVGTDAGKGVKHSFTIIYVGKHFEVREFDAPTKFVFNGDTRVARVTGTLSPNKRVQRLRVHPGWNLLSVAVTAERGGAQLASTGLAESILKWNPATRVFAVLHPTDSVAAGSVLWVKATDAGTLRVAGVYPGPRPNLRGPPEGDFVPGNGLEPWPMDSLVDQPSLVLWRFAPDLQSWQTKLSLPKLTFSDLPALLPPHEAVFAQAPISADLEAPEVALSGRFYHQDHLGSSCVITDTLGRVVEETANYPFGESRNLSSRSGTADAYGFIQKEQDVESGLGYFEARFLAIRTGRFTGCDPLARETPSRRLLFSPQMQNAYSYSINNPVGLKDSSGQFPVAGAVLGAGVEFGVQLVGAWTRGESWAVTKENSAKIVAAAALGAATQGLSAGASLARIAAVGGVGSAIGEVVNQLIDNHGRISDISKIAVSGITGGVLSPVFAQAGKVFTQAVSLKIGQRASSSVAAAGNDPLSIHWSRGGAHIVEESVKAYAGLADRVGVAVEGVYTASTAFLNAFLDAREGTRDAQLGGCGGSSELCIRGANVISREQFDKEMSAYREWRDNGMSGPCP
jgi:RHS repeat-associated protein